MKRLSVLLLTSFALLTGCEEIESKQATSPAKEPTIYFRHGFEIDVAGVAVPIHGVEDCPFGLAAPAGAVTAKDQAKCIKLADDTDHISVTLDFPSGAMAEVWKVTRDAPSRPNEAAFKHVSLYRPDGERITITQNADRMLDRCYVYEAAHVCMQ